MAAPTQTYSIANRDGSGSDGAGYPTIAEAISAVSPGATIFVRGGTFQELATFQTGRECCFWINKAIMLETYQNELPVLTYATVPTYDGADYGPIVYVSAVNAILRGLTIVGTHAAGDSPGGGDLDCNVLIQDGAHVMLDACMLQAFGHCGAKGNNITITDCTIQDGGFDGRDHGVYVYAAGAVQISGSTLRRAAGYGVHLYGTPQGVVVEDCTITDNGGAYVPVGGGGILCGGNGGHQIARNTITGNTGYGGLVLWKQDSINNVFTDNVITGNAAVDVMLDDAIQPQTQTGNTVGTFGTNTDDAAWPH